MKNFLIRHSALADLPVLTDLYRESREIMLSCGDVNQVGAFAFIPGEDPTCKVIEEGEWLDDSRPCGTIHLLNGDPRLAFQKILP